MMSFAQDKTQVETENLHTIVYSSRNCLVGQSEADMRQELEQILNAARRNNPPLDITGALLYSHGSFAQVLEGPAANVEQLFHKISEDPRHSDVSVLHKGRLRARRFPRWAMAFAGSNELAADPVANSTLEAIFSGKETMTQHLLNLLVNMLDRPSSRSRPA